jgi:hypothetical protein
VPEQLARAVGIRPGADADDRTADFDVALHHARTASVRNPVAEKLYA